MTEKTIEIGVVSVPPEWEQGGSALASGGNFGTGNKGTPGFRKLTEAEVADYLQL